MLYPLFVHIAWFFGLGLRNSEELCYGIALFCLWLQVAALTKDRVIAWGSVLPLAFFCYQHPVFNRSTYDSLQLILLPFSFSSSIQLYRTKADWRSVFWAGVVVALHALTRPEGFLFILPPVVSLTFVWHQSGNLGKALSRLKTVFLKFLSILAILILSQQVASFLNWTYCGFWAPTIIKSSSFQRSLSALMAIDPQVSYKIDHEPVPNSSLERGYLVSPALRKAKPYFDKNINGQGWSDCIRNYCQGCCRPDGSISGNFQYAWLDAGAYVAGEEVGPMSKYFDVVSKELQRGFDRGEIKKRWVIYTMLGPDFSIFDKDFRSSLWKVGRFFLNLTNPPLPTIEQPGVDKAIDNFYNVVALRRIGLPTQFILSGWVVNPAKGIPDSITLDKEAMDSGIILNVIERPGVAELVCGLKNNKAPHPMCGIQISSFGDAAGNLLVRYGNDTVAFGLQDLLSLTSNCQHKGVLLHVDKFDKISDPEIFPTTICITENVYIISRIFIFLSFLLLVILMLLQRSSFIRSLDFTPVLLVFSLMASIALPRLILLAVIDANMGTGVEPRYIASGALSIWFFGFFCVSFCVYNVIKILTSKNAA